MKKKEIKKRPTAQPGQVIKIKTGINTKAVPVTVNFYII